MDSQYIEIIPGLKKLVIKEGDGDLPKDNQEVVISYTGKFKESKQIFDSTIQKGPFKFIIGKERIIKGLDIGVKTMKKGEQSEFLIEPNLAYGEKGFPPSIPGSSTLIYEVTLEHFQDKIKTKWEMDLGEKLAESLKIKNEAVSLFSNKEYSNAKIKFEYGLSFIENLNSSELNEEINDRKVNFLVNICNCLNHLKNYDQVVKTVEKALKIKEHAKCYYFRGIAYVYLDEYDKANADFENLKKLLGNDPVIEVCHKMLNDRKIEKSKQEKKLFKSFMKFNSDSNNIAKSANVSKNSKVFLEIKIGENPAKKVEIELFNEKTPKTAENFRQLCIGFKNKEDQIVSYRNSKFHRLIQGFMIQGGDYENNDGTGGKSIYNENFNDESFEVSHDQAFLISMANSGPNTNGSQFFITLKESKHLDGKNVCFGRITSGQEVFKHLENIETEENSKPKSDITIVNCGEIA